MVMMTIKMRTMVHDIGGDFEDHTRMTITGPLVCSGSVVVTAYDF